MSNKVKVDAVEKQRRKRACRCGFNPHTMSDDELSNHRSCSVSEALENHFTFPSMRTLTNIDSPSDVYLEPVKRTLKRHWALLIDIHIDASLDRPTLLGFNQYGEQIIVAFYPNNLEPVTFSWDHLKPGNTLVILYAEKKVYDDGRQGIRQENLDTCAVFRAPLKRVQEEAQKLLDNADACAVEELEECFSCAKKIENSSRCSKCKLAKYCSRECQVKHWESGHKKLCTQSENLLRLAALPRQIRRFQNFSSFDSSKADQYLPAYGSK